MLIKKSHKIDEIDRKIIENYNNAEKYEITDFVFNEKTNKVNVTFKDDNLNDGNHIELSELHVGSRILLKGVQKITEEKLGKINQKLVKYVPIHHAIYLENGYFFHYYDTDIHKNKKILDFKDHKVIKSNLEEMKDYMTYYENSYLVIEKNIDNADLILERAKSLLGEAKYGWRNQCEDIVNYCLYGKKKSLQREILVKDSIKSLGNFIKKIHDKKIEA
jgi:hypothetical protein